MPANQVMKPKKKNIPQPLALRRPLRFLAGGKQLKLVVHSGIGIVNGTITNHIENYYVGSRDDVESELLPKVPYQRSEESYITNIRELIENVSLSISVDPGYRLLKGGGLKCRRAWEILKTTGGSLTIK